MSATKSASLPRIFPSPNFVLIICYTYVMLMPVVSWADQTYLFVKMGCRPESKSVSIHVFTESNEAGRELFEHHGKDVYPILDEIIITCDLGDGQTVGLGPSYTLPTGYLRQHTFISSTNMDLTSLPKMYHLDYTDWKVDIKPAGAGLFGARYCASTDTNFEPKLKRQFAHQFKEHKTICEMIEGGTTTYTVEGVPVEESK
jgi:hypothetical protein